MAHIVIAAQHVDVEIGLEMREEEIIRTVRDLILIAVQHIRIRMLVHIFHITVQRIRLDHVIMVQHGDEIALSHLQRCICVSGNAQILIQIPYLYTRIDGLPVVQPLHDAAVQHIGIDDTELQIGIALLQHGANHIIQIRVRRIENRNQDTEFGHIVKDCFPLFSQFEGIRAVRLEPCGILVVVPLDHLIDHAADGMTHIQVLFLGFFCRFPELQNISVQWILLRLHNGFSVHFKRLKGNCDRLLIGHLNVHAKVVLAGIAEQRVADVRAAVPPDPDGDLRAIGPICFVGHAMTHI